MSIGVDIIMSQLSPTFTDRTAQLKIPSVNVTGIPISALLFRDQIEAITVWAKRGVSKFVCVANVHMLMEAHWDYDFRAVLESADLVTPDGMPLVWLMRFLGCHNQDRVAGLDIFLAVCDRAQAEGHKIFFIGSTDDVLLTMRHRLAEDFPTLQVAGMISPPFHSMTEQEDKELVEAVNTSDASIVFVALGCPKQERWMKEHHGRINAVMIGVGAVFSLYAGFQKRAPFWVRKVGMEWLYRLVQEPRRLWKRYGTTIPPFIWLAMKQVAHVNFSKFSRHV